MVQLICSMIMISIAVFHLDLVRIVMVDHFSTRFIYIYIL